MGEGGFNSQSQATSEHEGTFDGIPVQFLTLLYFFTLQNKDILVVTDYYK